MRDRGRWHRPLTGQLNPAWPQALASFTSGDLLDVELGLYLLETVMPTRTVGDAWTLFGGYPYSEVFGDVRTTAQRLRVQRARHYLWSMRRRREWHSAIATYLTVPEELRGYDVKGLDAVPERRTPTRAATRFVIYEDVLTSSPPFKRDPLPVAGVGEYRFPVRDRYHSVVFTDDLVPGPAPRPHDLTALPPGASAPVEVAWSELEDAARTMDRIERAQPDLKRNEWERRLGRVKLLVRDDERGEFAPDPDEMLRIDGLLNLVGMVGAGKSTLRDILAFWAATGKPRRRITVVVGDVAEVLAVVQQFRRLGIAAAPILGQSTRERNIERLHRRTATAGAATMLSHDDPSFEYLSSACPLDALRGLEAARPLGIGEAPCTSLYPVSEPTKQDNSVQLPVWVAEESDMTKATKKEKPKRHACPLWTRCPRHHGARELVDATIWVATPAGLVHSGIPQHLHAERLRYLELACRMSDLVIVDEADRVQMQLDTAFAPATTLVGRGPNSWLDEVAAHKVVELARRGRLQLSAQDVDDWANATDTVTSATDRLYALLITDAGLRAWITEDYFSALTLHQWLINSWFPSSQGVQDPDEAEVVRRDARIARVDRILDRFRDDPLQEQSITTPAGDPDEEAIVVNILVHLTLELLHAQRDSTIRDRLRGALLTLIGDDHGITDDLGPHVTRFGFTLVLAALHHRLDLMTSLWPRVEAALNLEATSNVLSRRPPKDYEPIIPESPMGNVLGFQFQLGERNRDGDQSGELRFFRCSGVGRELLLQLPHLPAVDNRPGPNVMLMSATSWAGTSSRYHVNIEVGAVLRPHDDEVRSVLESNFRKEFLYWPGTSKALKLSGADAEQRPQVLTQMLHQLAVPDRSLAGATSLLEQELADIDDPDRRRILLLVGSYVEAKRAAEYLNAIPEWTGRVTLLVSDDADLDNAWRTLPGDPSLRTLSRSNVASFASEGGQILVAPLLAVERGHNIVVPGGKAAIGSVYFLARPHPRPDDIALAVQAINDWAVRQVRGPHAHFRQLALAAGTPDLAGLAFRREARTKWNRFLTRQLSWTSLPLDEKIAFTWDQLVVMWQVIGRLVRGGVAARVVFVDAAFSPREAGLEASDTPDTSLLESMRSILAPYFDKNSAVPAVDKSLVTALYEPLHRALVDMD
ncbi:MULTISPECIES: signal recognition particle [Saccharothrix]|uniref:pPIWI_RE_Z domain-containing protein n=1 Tax=Saccharothrix TaxID=2071 RepID=UPI00093E659B|nr:signal recognition particle [Saccharothrix sp. CB00851]OKI17395.1 signal recognition particle [Saccharothrix sp. CB00851]